MVLPRDPSTVPRIGEQSDELDPLRAEHGVASVTINPAISTDLQGKLAVAVARLEQINGFRSDSTEWDEACDQWGAGSFRGETGLARLRHILKVFLAEEDEQAPEVALKIAEFLRYAPKHTHDETVAAYTTALSLAQTSPTDEEERKWAIQDAVRDFADYLGGRQDIDSLADLVRTVGSDNDLISYLGLRNLVHQMRTAGQVDAAIAAAEALSASAAAVGANTEAADICAESVQALAESGRGTDAIEVCERAHASGWVSRGLANRHSLILERAKDWAGALEMCNQGLETIPFS